MSGITLEGKLYMLEQDRAFKGEDVVRFLKHLMHQIPGKLLIVWDGSPIHRSRAVKEFLASGASSRVQLEQLPGYAPDLNPDEGIWKHLKWVELKNLCCESLAQWRVELRKAKERLRHKKHVILGCIRQPGFEVYIFRLRSVELRNGEVLRIPLPRGWVNRGAGDPSIHPTGF